MTKGCWACMACGSTVTCSGAWDNMLGVHCMWELHDMLGAHGMWELRDMLGAHGMWELRDMLGMQWDAMGCMMHGMWGLQNMEGVQGGWGAPSNCLATLGTSGAGIN